MNRPATRASSNATTRDTSLQERGGSEPEDSKNSGGSDTNPGGVGGENDAQNMETEDGDPTETDDEAPICDPDDADEEARHQASASDPSDTDSDDDTIHQSHHDNLDVGSY